MTRDLDHRALHTETDAEVGNPFLPREFDRGDLPFDPADAEPARNKDAVHALEHFPCTLALDVL